MKNILILHDLTDARHCIENKLYLTNMLFSTHSSVDVYLKESAGIDCVSLSRYISYQEAKNFQSEASISVDQMLNSLDTEVSVLLDDQVGIGINYFTALYGYFGKFQLFGYLCLAAAIRKAIKSHGIARLRFYQYNFNRFFATPQRAEGFLKKLFSDVQLEVINYDKKGFISYNRKFREMLLKLFKKFNKFCTDPGIIFRVILRVIRCLRRDSGRLDSRRKSLIFTEPLYELDFLTERHIFKNKFNILDYQADQEIPSGFKGKIPRVDIDLTGIGRVFDDLLPQDPISSLLFEDIKSDFMNNGNSYINFVNSLNVISSRFNIVLGVWGIPPICGINALVYEYLKKKNIKVIGCQHGASYGETYYPWHFDSDFSRCDYFISYGFTQENLRTLYPDRALPAKILPFGKINIPNPKRKINKVDILFPIIQSMDMFSGGMLRTFLHEINDSQIKILEHLNSLVNLKVAVKPFANARDEDCSSLILKKKFKNIAFIENLSLIQFLENCLPRIVILELPSTSIYEIANLDTEIFLINDKFNSLSKDAYLKLDRRVHFSDDAQGLIKNLTLFLSGKLESKKDASFFNNYVYKKNAAENTAFFIESLAMGKTP